MSPVFAGCVQPLHLCDCWSCDTERRRRVREFSLRWFEEAEWRRLRRLAQVRIEAEAEANDLFPAAESGIRRTVVNTTHRALRPVTHAARSKAAT